MCPKVLQLIFAALCLFAHEATFKADYANLFLSHLSPSIMTTVKEIMPDWASLTPLNSKSQSQCIQQFLTAATTAEGYVENYALGECPRFQYQRFPKSNRRNYR
mmetsp:Transcript_13758/g.29130  ORF Transcript_13758/g.29130 Transcript_13758/m.29130 type:complete len:104 (+) Transcript_13758:400-711(+)